VPPDHAALVNTAIVSNGVVDLSAAFVVRTSTMRQVPFATKPIVMAKTVVALMFTAPLALPQDGAEQARAGERSDQAC